MSRSLKPGKSFDDESFNGPKSTHASRTGWRDHMFGPRSARTFRICMGCYLQLQTGQSGNYRNVSNAAASNRSNSRLAGWLVNQGRQAEREFRFPAASAFDRIVDRDRFQGREELDSRFGGCHGTAKWSQSVLTNRRVLLRQSLIVSMTNSANPRFHHACHSRCKLNSRHRFGSTLSEGGYFDAVKIGDTTPDSVVAAAKPRPAGDFPGKFCYRNFSMRFASGFLKKPCVNRRIHYR